MGKLIKKLLRALSGHKTIISLALYIIWSRMGLDPSSEVLKLVNDFLIGLITISATHHIVKTEPVKKVGKIALAKVDKNPFGLWWNNKKWKKDNKGNDR